VNAPGATSIEIVPAADRAPAAPPSEGTGDAAAVDTDGDWVVDSDEVNSYGTDPNSWDTDGDGRSDGDELYVIGTRIDGPEALAEPGALEGHVVQELLHGDEYTVNLFFDRSGALRCVVPHRRHEVRAGEVAKGVTTRHAKLEAIGWSLGTILEGARGPLCYQAIVDPQGRAAVFEINARFGGGYPLAHEAGARFSRWLLEQTLGLEPSCHDQWRDGVTMLRYDAALFR
jgi:hypothetical protein